jgi:hypothetical protein
LQTNAYKPISYNGLLTLANTSLTRHKFENNV